MTGKLFLGGGGNGKQSFEVDKLFLRGIKDILYIPVAWKNEDYSGCLNWFNGMMSQHKKLNIEMLTDLSRNVKLEDYDAVYIGGGNTYKLLKKIKESQFDKKLLEYYQRGGNVYGGSAGAIIWGRNISSASRGIDSDENLVNLEDISGLNILDGIEIQCHYRSSQLRKEKEYSKSTGITIIGIPEESGVLVQDHKMKAIGTKPITLITPEKTIKYSPGQRIK